MSSFYTPDMIELINKLREEGYSWPEVEKEFYAKFKIHKSHDTLRISAKNWVVEYVDEDEVDEEESVHIPVRQKLSPDLPSYLLYEPKTYPKLKAKKTGTALIIPDCHIPYHDQRAYELMLDVAKDVPDLNEIVILGDYADFYAVNSHGKHPSFNHVLLSEVTQVRKELERLCKLFPKAKKVFISGNHEYRLERYIQNQCPELFGIADTRTILKLDEMGYEYVEYGPNQKYKVLGSKLHARHEPIGSGAHAAFGTVAKAGCSVVYGHVHKIQQYRSVFMDGADHLAASVGWLGDKNSPVMQYIKSHAQWQLGMGLAHVVEGGNFFLEIMHIIDYTTHYNGKLYRR